MLHLLTGRVFGGAEEHALSILTAIREYGFEPCLAAPTALIAAMEPGLSAAGVKCLPLEFSSRLDVLTGARLLRFIRRENIAILHCHLFTASLFGAGVARMAGVGTRARDLSRSRGLADGKRTARQLLGGSAGRAAGGQIYRGVACGGAPSGRKQASAKEQNSGYPQRTRSGSIRAGRTRIDVSRLARRWDSATSLRSSRWRGWTSRKGIGI